MREIKLFVGSLLCVCVLCAAAAGQDAPGQDDPAWAEAEKTCGLLAEKPGDRGLLRRLQATMFKVRDTEQRARFVAIYALGSLLGGRYPKAASARRYLGQYHGTSPYQQKLSSDSLDIPCAKCDGTGKRLDGPCAACGGKGHIFSRRKAQEVYIALLRESSVEEPSDDAAQGTGAVPAQLPRVERAAPESTAEGAVALPDASTSADDSVAGREPAEQEKREGLSGLVVGVAVFLGVALLLLVLLGPGVKS